MENYKRAIYLLEAAKNYLIALENCGIIYNIDDITIDYDGTKCDGSCLAEDIKIVLEKLKKL